MMPVLEDIMATVPAPPKPSPHHAGYKSYSTSWYDEHGQRHFKRFGKVGETTKAAATAAYTRWINSEWNIKPQVRDGSGKFIFTVRELAEKYAELARLRYSKNGKLTSSIDQVEHALNALIGKHGGDPADSIGAPELTKLRDAMVHSKNRHGEDRILTASTVNGRLRIIKQAYRWARSQGLVTREAAVDVAMTMPVETSRGNIKPPRIVKPVPQTIIDKTIEHAPKTVGDMIRTQLLTGMRPGELCDMRVSDIDRRDANCWVYVPWRHKTEHKGKSRIVYIGARAQKILKPYINRRGLSDYVFLPVEAHKERLEMIGFEEVMAYQTSRSRFKPGRCYDNGTYRNAVNRSADRAFDPKGKARAGRDYSHRWHPHRLRHNFATMVRESDGVEAASALLGHTNLSTTEIYAERSEKLAKDIIRKVG